MAHIQIRISHEEKKAAQAVLDKLGLNFSSAIKLFFKQVVREQKLPFEISAIDFVTEEPVAKFQNNVQRDERSPFSARKIG